MNKIIIAGGSGLIGSYLSRSFEEKGYDYTILSRTPQQNNPHYAFWDPDKGILDENHLKGADFIINISGENVGKGRWTEKRKQAIIESRVQSAKLLLETCKKLRKKPKAYISASATGYYGMEETPMIHTESESPANDFLGQTCKEWENAAFAFKKIGIRTVVLRTGLVLAKEAKAWKLMKRPVQLGLGAALGSGRQNIPWIHITDIVNLYHYAMFNKGLKGAFNAVSPEYTDMNTFNYLLSKQLKRPYFMPPIPGFVIRLFMGEKAALVLNGNRISSEKIQHEGFNFAYAYIEKAFADLCDN